MNKTLKLNLKMLVFALFLVVIDQISKYAAIIALKGKNDFHHNYQLCRQDFELSMPS